MKDVNGDHCQIIKTMQDQIDYLMEFIDIQGEILEEKCGSPQKLDNLNRCKMACKLKQKGPFYEKVLRQQIQESRSA